MTAQVVPLRPGKRTPWPALPVVPADAPVLFRLDAAGVRLGKTQALREVSLQIQAGERIALVGANGSGKSSLLRLLNGLLAPNQGDVRVPPARAQAMLFQRPHMLRTSARNNVALGLWLAGWRWREAQDRALIALERTGLAELAQRQARELSGGQQQRLALARAWARQPQVLLLDEPTASLDPHAKREVEKLVAEFAAGGTQGVRDHLPPMTLVFASHNLGQVKRLASRVIYLEKGRVLADVPVATFFDDAQLLRISPAAQGFVRSETG
ncbi:ATP-binding cassette domain-containing protein [Hydrogenophaga sp. OTU3427]|uniref:ATP-binding cassette domain-containing protein n=1 Tax=Hydrogenophaga sp. OTU3427 TaxID=3043856 RepID=UPI00313C1775